MENRLIMHDLIPSNKSISRVRERYYEGQKGPISLDSLCEYLNKTTKTNLFDVLIKALHEVQITCSIFTAFADDAGETMVAIDKNGIIKGVDELEIPNMRRYSMMFFPYIFEGTRVIYYTSRIGMKYEEDVNKLVLPYFVTLYAIEHSEDCFDPKSISAAKSHFIVSLYSALTNDIANIRDGMKATINLVIHEAEINTVTHDEGKFFNPTAHVIGIMKAITLYEMCKETGDFDSILQAVLDNSKDIGNELDYNNSELDIKGQNVIKRCEKFIRENAHHLRNIGEPDEYEPPTFN